MREAYDLSRFEYCADDCLEEDDPEKKLVWHVFAHDVNSRKIIAINLFEFNWVFTNRLLKINKEKDMSFESFAESVMNALRHEYWARAEYETIITSWPPHINSKELDRLNAERDDRLSKGYNFICESVELDVCKKIDIYTQIMMNWHHFIKYVWEHRNLIDDIEEVDYGL